MEEVNEESKQKETLFAAALHLKDLDNGKDEPGTKHLPEETGNLKLIRQLPEVYKEMFRKLEKKFGKWVPNKDDREDDFPVFDA